MTWSSVGTMMLIMALFFVALWVFVRGVLFILDLRDQAGVELERSQRSQTGNPDRKFKAA